MGPIGPTSEQDLADVEARIGRRPRGVWGVLRRCESGAPQVILTAPVQGEAIFPTLFWLACPALRREVGRLESAGWVGRLTDRVREDAGFRCELGEAHRRAAILRRRVAGVDALSRLQEAHPGKYRVIAGTGVAGIESEMGVKCLHAHLADHLALGGNPVGSVTIDLLRSRGLDPANCPV